MNTRKEIQTQNNRQTEANSDVITVAMIALLMTLMMLFGFGGIIYTNNKQTNEIDELNKQKNSFMFKYLNEQSEADKLAKDLCKTKFSEFAPRLRYELDDGRVCRVVIENTFADTAEKWQKLFNNCKLNKSANLSDQYKLLRGKCDSLNVEVFIKQATNQQ